MDARNCQTSTVAPAEQGVFPFLIIQDGHGHWVAKPATAADELPKVAYIEPPPLQKVPYNGLAKTPPMGWSSWNLFQGKIDDKTVRTLADGSVAVGVVNLGSAAAKATINASDLKLAGVVKSARDLWSHKTVKFSGGAYSTQVPSHGMLLLRISFK
jgi:hypothetical protein